jgi:hypothetical protein
VDGKPYIYEGITDAEKQGRRMSDDSVLQNRAFKMAGKIKSYKTFEGDINLESISIADNDARDPQKQDLLLI